MRAVRLRLAGVGSQLNADAGDTLLKGAAVAVGRARSHWTTASVREAKVVTGAVEVKDATGLDLFDTDAVDTAVLEGRAVVVRVTTILGVTKSVEAAVGPAGTVVVCGTLCRRITKTIGATDSARVGAVKIREALLLVVAKAVGATILAQEAVEIALTSVGVIAEPVR